MATTARTGTFIAFEGGEGSGKTTQISLLSENLTHAGLTVVKTREPGGTPLGQHIRKLVLDPSTDALDHRTEALLFAADRAEHVATLIRPALAHGNVVITDRYMDSSAAYQGAGRGLSRDEIIRLSMWATDDLVPDLTVVLDVDPRVGLRRVLTTEFGTPDRIESEPLEFADSVRAGFLALAAKNPQRYVVLDANQPAADLAQLVLARVQALLDPTPQPDRSRTHAPVA